MPRGGRERWMRRCLVKAKGARTKARRRGREREGFVLETVRWHRPAPAPAAEEARLRPGVRHPPPPGDRARSSARATCARTPGWPGCRTGRPACCGRTRRGARAWGGLGPARVPPLLPDPPRRAGGFAADADGEVEGTRRRRMSAATSSRPRRRSLSSPACSLPAAAGAEPCSASLRSGQEDRVAERRHMAF